MNTVKFWLWPMSPDMKVRLCQKCLQRILGTKRKRTPAPCDQGLFVGTLPEILKSLNSDDCHWMQPLLVPPRSCAKMGQVHLGMFRGNYIIFLKATRRPWTPGWSKPGPLHALIHRDNDWQSSDLSFMEWYIWETQDTRSFLLLWFLSQGDIKSLSSCPNYPSTELKMGHSTQANALLGMLK